MNYGSWIIPADENALFVSYLMALHHKAPEKLLQMTMFLIGTFLIKIYWEHLQILLTSLRVHESFFTYIRRIFAETLLNALSIVP